ncbi:MAG: 30S ribosomal protein S20, partial [Smithellaceae bacterium]|nr:30S ribosomal protein S20 [Smithellaceae bacterium]
KSAEKRSRQSEVRRVRNASVKTGVKTAVKSVLTAVTKKDKEAAQAALKAETPTIAKAAAKGVLHKKTAARRISRLTKKVNALK